MSWEYKEGSADTQSSVSVAGEEIISAISSEVELLDVSAKGMPLL